MAMEAQLQIRQNALEVQEYMKDLFEWQQSIKSKERNKDASAPAGLPAPRGRAHGAAVAAAPEDLQAPGLSACMRKPRQKQGSRERDPKSNGGSTAAAHTYTSYSKWDHLDVDAMLASSGSEVDSDVDKGASASPTSKEKAGIVRPQQLPGQNAAAMVAPAPRDPALNSGLLQPIASTRSDTGVAASKGSKPASAEPGSAYPSTTASPSQPAPAVRNSEPQTADAWRARGNDLFRAGQWAFAKECYRCSLALDPRNAAALANRAMAELKLEQWAEAEEDCTAALELDPAYVKALHRRGIARQHLNKHLQAAQDFEGGLLLEPANTVLAADRAAAVAAHVHALGIPAGARRTRVPVTLAHPVPATLGTPHGGSHGPGQPARSQGPQEPLPQSHGTRVSGCHEQTSTAEGGQHPTSLPGVNADKASSILGTRPKIAVAAEAAAAALATRTLQGGTRAPKTSIEFEANWRSFQGSLDFQTSYLSLLQPDALPQIFKSSMTPAVLAGVLRTLLSSLGRGLQGSDAESHASRAALTTTHALALLAGLERVPRIEMTAMCIPGKERQELSDLWEAALGALEPLSELEPAAVAAALAVRPKLKV